MCFMLPAGCRNGRGMRSAPSRRTSSAFSAFIRFVRCSHDQRPAERLPPCGAGGLSPSEDQTGTPPFGAQPCCPAGTPSCLPFALLRSRAARFPARTFKPRTFKLSGGYVFITGGLTGLHRQEACEIQHLSCRIIRQTGAKAFRYQGLYKSFVP